MRGSPPTFHPSGQSTRSDCSGRGPIFSSILSAIYGPVSRQDTCACEPFVTILIVKRLVLQQGRLLVKHLMPAVIKPLHTLWHEIISFVFLCFAVFLGFRLVKAFRAQEISAIILVGFGFVICAGYGLSSYLRARKISRS